MRLIVTGSLAFDHIMVFRDQFKNHILPEKVHMINVSFPVENLKKEFGGTAGNIAYSLALLGDNPEIVAAVGEDFEVYKKHLQNQNISTKEIKILENQWTAQCFITTDMDDNQITAFHGGAMFEAHQKELKGDFVNQDDLVIIAPNGRDAMLQYADFCRNNQIKFIFDPGQSLPAFNGEEIKAMLKGSEIMTVNDYEWQLIQEKTGLSEETIFDFTENLIVTLGKEGSLLNQKGSKSQISVVKADAENDPTGCGDAYRAGLMFGLKQNFTLDKSVQIASAVASFAIEQHGTQNHKFTLGDLGERYKMTFGESLELV